MNRKDNAIKTIYNIWKGMWSIVTTLLEKDASIIHISLTIVKAADYLS